MDDPQLTVRRHPHLGIAVVWQVEYQVGPDVLDPVGLLVAEGVDVRLKYAGGSRTLIPQARYLSKKPQDSH